MTEPLAACITDANVWIDLHAGGLVEEVFSLPYRWMAVDLVIAELQNPDGRWLLTRGLLSCELDAAQVSELAHLAATRGRRVSVADLASLLLAKAMDVPLLTGDSRLRRLAEQEAIAVHGTLWLLDEMVRLSVIDRHAAAAALESMRAAGGRFPEEEYMQRIRHWREIP